MVYGTTGFIVDGQCSTPRDDARSQARNGDASVVVDGGGVVQVAKRPTFGARALVRRFANLSRRVPVPVACRVVRLNGEPAVLVTLPSAGNAVFASVHVETSSERIVAMRVVRDPAKLAPLQEILQ